MRRKCLPHFGYELDEMLRVSVGDVQADEFDFRYLLQNLGQLLEVSIGDSCATRNEGQRLRV